MCLATMCLDFGGYCNLFWLGHLMRLDVDLVELRRMNWWTGVWVKPAEQVFCKCWAASIGPYSYLSSGLHLLLLKCCLWINRSESVQISTRPFLLNPQSCNLAASGPCSVYRPPLAALCLTMYIRRNWFHFREILHILHLLLYIILNFFPFSPLQSKATFISGFYISIWRALSCPQTPFQDTFQFVLYIIFITFMYYNQNIYHSVYCTYHHPLQPGAWLCLYQTYRFYFQ